MNPQKFNMLRNMLKQVKVHLSTISLNIHLCYDKNFAIVADERNLSSVSWINSNKKYISWVSKEQSNEFLHPLFIEWITNTDPFDHSTWMTEISEDHNAKKDVMTSYCKILMYVNTPEIILQVIKNTLFHILHLSTRELFEKKSVTHNDVITREKAGDMYLEEANSGQIKRSKVVLETYFFEL